MTNTKAYAAFNATEPLGPFTINRRDPGPTEVQLEILYCGICHSDLHQVKNEWGGTRYPLVPGHEIVGRVLKTGKDVSKFREGDIAGVGCLVNSCRHCTNCKNGLEQYCENGFTGTYNSMKEDPTLPTYGGYSKMITVTEDFVLKVPDNLPLEGVAPLLCAGITTFSPMKHWKVGRGHRVAVIGLGGLGHMAVKLAASFGAEVTMLSTSAEKEKDARHLGAHHFALTRDPSQLSSLTNSFDFIIDTVSAEHDYNMYLKMLRTDGVMICLGAPPVPSKINALGLIGNRRSLVGSLIGGLPQTQEMLDYCGAHNIISDVEVIRMDYINEAYVRMLKGDVKYRFVVDMSTL